jgi:hypothetical protein
MNDRFVVLAMDNGRNWTNTANDCYVEIDPVSDSVATVWLRRTAELHHAPNLTFFSDGLFLSRRLKFSPNQPVACFAFEQW